MWQYTRLYSTNKRNELQQMSHTSVSYPEPIKMISCLLRLQRPIKQATIKIGEVMHKNQQSTQKHEQI